MPHNNDLKLAVLTAQMSALWGRLKRDGTGARQVRFLSITVDPARDSAAPLERYVKRFKADPARWSFLREERQKLQPVLAAYDEWTRPSLTGRSTTLLASTSSIDEDASGRSTASRSSTNARPTSISRPYCGSLSSPFDVPSDFRLSVYESSGHLTP